MEAPAAAHRRENPRRSLIRRAIVERKQLRAIYDGLPREICPHVLGRTGNRWRLLAFQFGGSSKRGLPPGGDWRCFDVARLSEVTIETGPWHTREHSQPQHCVERVEVAAGPGEEPG